MRRIIRKNLGPFAAILGLIAISIGVGGYILSQQRLRFPFLQGATTRINVALDNAQAVTPGQGQTAQVSGVQIGSIADVQLKDGHAIVGIDVEPKFKHLIHPDATAMLRPRTGLKDMYIQIFPGRAGKPVRAGFTIPAQNTLTDTDVDQILSELDQRTRDYVTLLVNGAGDGLKNRGNDLAQVFDRFAPTFRDLSRVNRSVGKEHTALARLVHSLKEVSGALATKPRDVSQLVSTASTTLHAFAAEDVNLRASVSELAPTLTQATSTLRAVTPFALELGPTTRALIPAVRQLDIANRQVRPFAKEATPIVRRKIRPFVRSARPLVRDLKPAAKGLAKTFPDLNRSATVLNHLFNMAAYNPNGQEPPGKPTREEGYLFWLAWVTHQGVNLQNVDDANGPMRPIFLTGSCGTLTSLVNDEPALEFALGLSPLLATVCKDPNTASLNLGQALKVIGGVPGSLSKTLAALGTR